MTTELYNELLNDFNNFYQFYKNKIDSTQESSQKIIECIKKGDIESLVTMKNPYEWFSDYFKMSSSLIEKLDSIDPKFTAKFHERQLSEDPMERSKNPEIFILFKKLVIALDQEDYTEADRLKEKIFRKY